jgi:hypothetical protein
MFLFGDVMAGYSKQFLIDVALDRFLHCTLITVSQLESLEKMYNEFYDVVGRDAFRTYASVDAEAIKTYKNNL